MNKKGQGQLPVIMLKASVFMVFVVILALILGYLGLSFSGTMLEMEMFQNNLVTPLVEALGDAPLLYDILAAAAYLTILIASIYFMFISEPEDGIFYILSWFAIIFISGLQIILGYVLSMFAQTEAFNSVLAAMFFVPVYIEYSFILGLTYLFIAAIALHIKR